jgi:hypothetical protein
MEVRRMKNTGGYALVILAAVCVVAAAGVARSDESMAMPTAGPEVKALAPIFETGGTWKGKMEAGAMGPESKETVTHGKAVSRPILGGLWYACDVEDNAGTGKDAMSWKGHILVGYDLTSKSYKAACVDNMGTITMFDGRLEGSKFVLETPNEVMMMGTMMKDRLTWDFSNPKAIQFTDEHMVSGGDWQLAESATMQPSSKSSTKHMMAEAEDKK